MQFYNCPLNYACAAERNHIKRPLFTNAQGSRERVLVKLFSLVVSVPPPPPLHHKRGLNEFGGHGKTRGKKKTFHRKPHVVFFLFHFHQPSYSVTSVNPNYFLLRVKAKCVMLWSKMCQAVDSGAWWRTYR